MDLNKLITHAESLKKALRPDRHGQRPDLPEDLEDVRPEAQAEYRRIKAMDHIQEIDEPAVILYCLAYDLWIQGVRDLNDDRPDLRGPRLEVIGGIREMILTLAKDLQIDPLQLPD